MADDNNSIGLLLNDTCEGPGGDQRIASAELPVPEPQLGRGV